MSCEYLLLNGARINCRDVDGKTPLYLATELGIYRHIIVTRLSLHILFQLHVVPYAGHTAQVCLLLKHRADQHIEDESGVKPLSIAVKEANADIVTL